MFKTTLTPAQAASQIMARLAHPQASPTLLLGPPGVGKSAVGKAAALAWIATQYGGTIPPEARPYVDIRAGDYDAVDFTGVPYVDIAPGPNGGPMLRTTAYAQPIMLPVADRDGPHGVVMLDEVTGAPLATQQVLYRLLLDREINNYRLPDGWRVIGAGNRKEDRAAAQPLSTAFASRCWVAEVRADARAWIEWAIDADAHPAIIGYIQAFPQALHIFDPKVADPRFPCPRSWHKLSLDIETMPAVLGRLTGDDATMRLALVAGHLGDAIAPTVAAYLATFGSLPQPAAILADPIGVPLPAEQSLVVAAVTMVARAVTRDHAAQFYAFLGRRDIAPDIAALGHLYVQRLARTSAQAASVIATPQAAAFLQRNAL